MWDSISEYSSLTAEVGPESWYGTGVRLHDARHTAATVLLILGVSERVVMQIMGRSSTAMAARYQHVTGGILADVAQRVGGLIWEVAKAADENGPDGSGRSR